VVEFFAGLEDGEGTSLELATALALSS
jgi:hypothetical protein